MKNLICFLIVLIGLIACNKDDSPLQPVDPNPTDTTQTPTDTNIADTIFGSGVFQSDWNQDKPNRHYIVSQMVTMDPKPFNGYLYPNMGCPANSLDQYAKWLWGFDDNDFYVMTAQAPGMDSPGNRVATPLFTPSYGGMNRDTYGYTFVIDTVGDYYEPDAYLIGSGSFDFKDQFGHPHENYCSTCKWADLYAGQWTFVAIKPGALGYCTDGTPIETVTFTVDGQYYADEDPDRPYNTFQISGGPPLYTGQDLINNTIPWRVAPGDTLLLNTVEAMSNKVIDINGSNQIMWRTDPWNIYTP